MYHVLRDLTFRSDFIPVVCAYHEIIYEYLHNKTDVII